MNNNQTKKLIKLESLDNTQIESKLQELSLEEVSFIQGGWKVEGSPDLTTEKYFELIKRWREKYCEGGFYGLCPNLPMIL